MFYTGREEGVENINFVQFQKAPDIISLMKRGTIFV
jgi:hypothetical protein